MTSVLSAIFQPLKLVRQGLYISTSVMQSSVLATTELSLLTQIRTKVRCYFPRPNEVKRVRRHGWATRMSTPNGRKVIMRRLLKGRYVLTH